jgi:hypothetical protein
MVADSVEVADVTAEESVEAELGVVELEGVLEVWGVERLLSMERRGFAGRANMGAADVGTGASYAFVKVLRTVGETALSVSSRSEVELLPKVRSW